MTDWILTFQVSSPQARDHAIARWKKTKSALWLVAAIGKVDAQHPEATALRNAANGVASSSPAFPSAAFHSVRLQIEAGEIEGARARLDALLKEPSVRNLSAQNLLRAARMKVARDVNELALFAPRLAHVDIWNEAGSSIKDSPQFDADFVTVFNNQMSLTKMVELVNSKKLPEHLHRFVVLTAWTRAVLLGRHDVALTLSDETERVSPALKLVLRDYRAASTPEARRYSAAYALLSFPPLAPYVSIGPERMQEAKLAHDLDHWRDNWWCKPEFESPGNDSFFTGGRFGYEWNSAALQSLYRGGKAESPSFLDAAARAAAKKENQELAQLPAAPNYLAAVAVEWAKAQPKNPLVPEALHLAVMGTRWGCGDKQTEKFSKAAFQLLHRKYPQSEWTKKTKYYYGQ